MPLFWLGIMLIIIFAVRLKVLPASGYGTWQHFLMPVLLPGRRHRAHHHAPRPLGRDRGHEHGLHQDGAAEGHGGAPGRWKHAFRNACIPVITVLGLQFGQLLGGAIITETVFAWPGVATLTVDSIRNQDFPVVQCAVVLLALDHRRGEPHRGHGRWASSTRASGRGHERGIGAGPRSPWTRAPPAPRPTRGAPPSGGSRGSGGAWPPPPILLVIVLSAAAGALDLAPRPARGGHPPPARAARVDGRGARPITCSAPTRWAAISSRA